jgi:hypothetical protein
VIGFPFSDTDDRPDAYNRRVSSISPPSAATGMSVTRSISFCTPLFATSNTPETRPSSTPPRSISAGLRNPSSTSTAPITSDFPAPVAPVKQFNPRCSSIRASAITARLEMWSSLSIPAVKRPTPND